ncbi:MAG TPA: DUF4136 domain-containing protein [Vicinamibacterales bacterium]|nr:DUF4136 domain-containing protein [Vicinamibacterales bacterium]
MRTIARGSIGVVLTVLSFVPAVAAAQKVSYDFRQHQSLLRPRTFAFKPVKTPDTAEQTTIYDSPFMDERTDIAIAVQLEQRGWTRDDDNPEVYVVTRRTTTEQTTFYGPYWSAFAWPWGGSYPQYGYGLGAWDLGWGPVIAQETLRGVLTIDLEQVSNGTLLWRGVGSKHLDLSSKPSSRTKHVNDEVSDIFRYFPPSK